MTRRPIFTGIATILVLALTAGLAYGAGHLVSTRNYANQMGRQGPQVVAAVPGFQGFHGRNANGHFAGMGAAFRNQMRDWMRDRFTSWREQANFAGNRQTTWNRNHRDRGTSYGGSGSTYGGNGYHHHDSGYGHDHMGDHMGSGSWSGGHQGGCCGW